MINLRHLRLDESLECLSQGIGNLVSLHTLRACHVDGSNIKLLKKLNQLEGHLSIYGLDLIQSSEDAYEAMLSNKENLQSLLFNFKRFLPGDVIKWIGREAEVTTVVDVFAALQPPSLLGILKIMNYRGSKFSNWIASVEMLPNLRKLELDHCNCVELPALGKLPSLEHLNISHMHQLKHISSLHNVKHIGTDFYGDDGGYVDSVTFPKLEELRINRAPKLVGWDVFATAEGVDVMPCLRKLELQDCGLKALPALGKLRLLKELRIIDLKKLKHLGSEFYGAGVDDHANRVAFPELETLQILGLGSLKEWTFGAEKDKGGSVNMIMPRVRHMYIRGLKLKMLPALGELPSLETLELWNLRNVEHIGPEFYGLHRNSRSNAVVVTTAVPVFPKLYRLEMWKMPNLKSWVPESTESSMCVMPCSRDLKIGGCPNLESLPLHLSNTLMSLSWSVSSLTTPPAIGQLEALQDLKINQCEWRRIPTENRNRSV